MPKDSQLYRLALILLDETNVIVTSLTAAWCGRNLVLNRRPAGSLYFVGGAVGTMLIAKALKRILRIPRPATHQPSSTTSRLLSTHFHSPSHTSYGFPSTHSTTISFFSSYIFLSLLFPPSPSSSLSLDPRHVYEANPLLGLAALVGGGVVCWSRVRLGHHDAAQVLGGVVLGLGCGVGHWIGWNGTGIVGGGWEGWRGRGEGLWDLTEAVGRRVWGEMRR